jgi:hypothetical protein
MCAASEWSLGMHSLAHRARMRALAGALCRVNSIQALIALSFDGVAPLEIVPTVRDLLRMTVLAPYAIWHNTNTSKWCNKIQALDRKKLSQIALVMSPFRNLDILANSALAPESRLLPSRLLVRDCTHHPDEREDERGRLGDRRRAVCDVIELEGVGRTRCHDPVEAIS